jgi:hypothetical protein
MRGEDVKVIQKHYELMLWYFRHVEKFPRSQRFVVGDRIETLLLDILDQLIGAKFSRTPAEGLRRANLALERLRYLTRLSVDLDLLTGRQYAFAAECIDDVGRQVGGWLKASEPTR